MAKIEVDQSDYERLTGESAKVPTLESKVTELTAKAEKVPELEKAVEKAEAEKVKAEGERDSEKKLREEAEEKANQSKLREERFEALGTGFLARLEKAPTTKTRLTDDAGKLDDDAWKARLSELAEAFGVKADATGDENPSGRGDETAALFNKEEVAGAGFGGQEGAGGSAASTDKSQRAVIGGLARSFGKKSEAKS